MIDSLAFVKEMLLESDDTIVSLSVAHERNLIRRVYAALESKSIDASTATVTLDEDTVDIIQVAFNHKILHRTTELTLDSLNPAWRSAVDTVPRDYIWRGEEPLRRIRLYPIPSLAGTLQVIRLREPAVGVARWHDVYIALLATGRVASVDLIRSRPKMEEVLVPLAESIYESLAEKDARNVLR